MNRELRSLYRDCPSFACKPGCTACCGPVPFMGEEWDKVVARLPPDAEVQGAKAGYLPTAPGTKHCAFRTATGCSIYDDRPFMCRLFGTADTPSLTCMHGCQPKRRMTEDKAGKMTTRYIRMNMEGGV